MKLRFFNLARKLSLKSDYHHKLGAVIVSKNIVIGKGYNKPFKTHPKSNYPWHTQHAEFVAILEAGDCKGADIYVFREYKNGNVANSKPCPYCTELIKRAGIKRVYYTDNNSFKEEIV
jgi:tRNA(Arg) A34 adenosine deaminase TadA